MKTRILTMVLVFVMALVVVQVQAAPLGTEFTYQGRLIDANDAADGEYDFQFKLYDADSDGNQRGIDVNIAELDVIDGYFTVELDFGSVFNGDTRWLQIGIRPGDMNDPNVYTILKPRQEVTPAPYALYAANSGSDADWIVDGDDLYSIPSGNVGIGTTSPEKKLDIAGENYTDLGIGLTSKSPGGTSWSIDNDGGVFKIVEHASCGQEFLNNTRIAVVGNCIGSPYGGNVGIGTTNPEEKLHVFGKVKIVDGSQGNGNVLTSDSQGVGTWEDLSAKYYTKSQIDAMFYTKTELDPRLLTSSQKSELIGGGVTSLHYHPTGQLEAWPTFHIGTAISGSLTGIGGGTVVIKTIGECGFSKVPGSTIFRVSSRCKISTTVDGISGIQIGTSCGSIAHHPNVSGQYVYYEDLFDCQSIADYGQIVVSVDLIAKGSNTVYGDADVYVQQNAP